MRKHVCFALALLLTPPSVPGHDPLEFEHFPTVAPGIVEIR